MFKTYFIIINSSLHILENYGEKINSHSFCKISNKERYNCLKPHKYSVNCSCE